MMEAPGVDLCRYFLHRVAQKADLLRDIDDVKAFFLQIGTKLVAAPGVFGDFADMDGAGAFDDVFLDLLQGDHVAWCGDQVALVDPSPVMGVFFLFDSGFGCVVA